MYRELVALLILFFLISFPKIALGNHEPGVHENKIPRDVYYAKIGVNTRIPGGCRSNDTNHEKAGCVEIGKTLKCSKYVYLTDVKLRTYQFCKIKNYSELNIDKERVELLGFTDADNEIGPDRDRYVATGYIPADGEFSSVLPGDLQFTLDIDSAKKGVVIANEVLQIADGFIWEEKLHLKFDENLGDAKKTRQNQKEVENLLNAAVEESVKAHIKEQYETMEPSTPEVSKTDLPQGPAPSKRLNEPLTMAEPVDDSTGENNYIKSQLFCGPQRRHYQMFMNKFGEDLKNASSAFKIPIEYLTCLIFKESKFDPKAISGSGALGLGQLMPPAIHEGMRFYIKGISIDDNEKAETEVKLAEADLNYQNSPLVNPVNEKKVFLGLRQKIGFYKTNRMWKEYVEYLDTKETKVTKNSKSIPEYVTKSNEFAKSVLEKLSDADKENINLMDIRILDQEKHWDQIQSVSIGIIAMYLKTIAATSDTDSNETKLRLSDIDKYIVNSGGYNSGPSLVSQAQDTCGHAVRDRNTYESCLSRMIKVDKTNWQTAGYAKSIENCLKAQLNQTNNVYNVDSGGTEFQNDQLSLNQTESFCFMSGGQLATHKFVPYMSCNDAKKIYGLYTPGSKIVNSCQVDNKDDKLPGAAKVVNKNLSDISGLLDKNGFKSGSSRPSLIHGIGRANVCVQYVKGVSKSTRCPLKDKCLPGYKLETDGFYATMSAPDEIFSCQGSASKTKQAEGADKK